MRKELSLRRQVDPSDAARYTDIGRVSRVSSPPHHCVAETLHIATRSPRSFSSAERVAGKLPVSHQIRHKKKTRIFNEASQSKPSAASTKELEIGI
jgi:hypothetical protein